MLDSIGDVKARPGEAVYGSLAFEGHKLPALIAQGKSDGPTLLVLGLQHATEFSGPGGVDGALEHLDPAGMRGTLVCLPVANPVQVGLDFEQHSALHKNPETNLNRQWPGEAGSDNQLSRLAALIWKEAVARCDALVDMHCCRKVDPRFSAALEGHGPSEALALALGLEAVDLQTAESYASGLLFVAAAEELGVPAVLVESHPGGFQVREAVEACTAVVMRALAHMKVIDPWRPPARPAPGRAPIFHRGESGHSLKPERGGYLAVRRWAGEQVAEGETVAAVRGLETFEVIEEIVSPIEGAVGCVGSPSGAGLIKPGEVAATVKRVD